MTDKITKLSQAIRLGATFRPHCQEPYMAKEFGGVLHTCAMGAAAEAVGIEVKPFPGKQPYRELYERFACIQEENEIIKYEIWARNRYQTREQIADWLESIGL